MLISQRINAERLMLVAWPRAILLQLAHPLVAAGVAGHSSFRQSPMTAVRRLHSTVRAMLALVFGTPEAHERALNGIRAIHRRVNGQLAETVGPFPAGTRYSAEDPALLLWVHATLIESIVLAYDALVAPLAPADRDAYVDEAAGVAIALGARENEVPRTWPALTHFLQDAYRSGRIVVGPEARDLAPAITAMPLRFVTAPCSWALRLVTIGSLPPEVREQYARAWRASDDRAANAVNRVLRATRRGLPRVIAWWPEARRGGVRS